MEKMSVPALHRMKREGRKIVGVVAWDVQMAKIVDRAGVDIVVVGDSVGVNPGVRRALSRSRSTKWSWSVAPFAAGSRARC